MCHLLPYSYVIYRNVYHNVELDIEVFNTLDPGREIEMLIVDAWAIEMLIEKQGQTQISKNIFYFTTKVQSVSYHNY